MRAFSKVWEASPVMKLLMMMMTMAMVITMMIMMMNCMNGSM